MNKTEFKGARDPDGTGQEQTCQGLDGDQRNLMLNQGEFIDLGTLPQGYWIQFLARTPGNGALGLVGWLSAVISTPSEAEMLGLPR